MSDYEQEQSNWERRTKKVKMCIEAGMVRYTGSLHNGLLFKVCEVQIGNTCHVQIIMKGREVAMDVDLIEPADPQSVVKWRLKNGEDRQNAGVCGEGS